MFVVSVFLIVFVFIPLTVHASVFSFISSLFAPTVSAAELSLPNSQTLALLETSHSPGLSTTSSNDLSIMDGTSLSSQTQNSLVGTEIPEHTMSNDHINLYVVHAGDTLPAIAKMFGVSTNTILWANDLKGGKVTVGDKLVILPISGVKYTVKSGDTLFSIAKKYKGDPTDIALFNDLSADAKLVSGQSIIIPDGEITTSESGFVQHSQNGGKNQSSSNGAVVHVSAGGTSRPAADALPAPSNSAMVGATGIQSPTIIGYYERPILGGIKTQSIHGHNGIDLSSSYGSAILASAAGEVIISKSSGWNGGYGSYIVVKHDNGTQTLYAHLSATLVSVGDVVGQGQVIGHMGSTGESTGTHLHFEVRGATNPF